MRALPSGSSPHPPRAVLACPREDRIAAREACRSVDDTHSNAPAWTTVLQAIVSPVLRTPLIIVLAILDAGCASSRTQPASRPSDAKALEKFQEETEEYVELHNKLESRLPSLPAPAPPAQVQQHVIALADLIASARRKAKRGDIFVREVEPLIRARAQTVFASVQGGQDKAAIRDEQSERSLEARVNQRYPEDVPVSTVTASVLASLPPLPEVLEYRFLGRHLILMDVGARLIVDYLPDVLPR